MSWGVNHRPVIEMEEIDGAQLAVVTFAADEAVSDFCLGLVLLARRLVDCLWLPGESGRGISVALHEGDPAVRAYVTRNQHGLVLGISARELEYWLDFFLRFARDGISDVDHIDIEATPKQARDQRADVVLKVPRAQEPVSAAKARRRLGL